MKTMSKAGIFDAVKPELADVRDRSDRNLLHIACSSNDPAALRMVTIRPGRGGRKTETRCLGVGISLSSRRFATVSPVARRSRRGVGKECFPSLLEGGRFARGRDLWRMTKRERAISAESRFPRERGSVLNATHISGALLADFAECHCHRRQSGVASAMVTKIGDEGSPVIK